MDGIFSHVQKWLDDFLRAGQNQLISPFEDLLAACQRGAALDGKADPDGVQWVVLPFTREQKPETY